MKTQRRWMNWVLEEAEKPMPAMPWQNNARCVGNKIERLRITSVPFNAISGAQSEESMIERVAV